MTGDPDAAPRELHGESSSDIDFLAAAPPVFDILNPDTGEASHNPVMSSYGAHRLG